MHKSLPILLLLTLLLPGAALAQQGGTTTLAGPEPYRGAQPQDPEELYDRGLRQMKRGYYDEAILNFERVRNHFPFNQYSVLSELRVADCLYEKSSYIEAVDAYRDFMRLHPRHAEIDYVVYRTARAEFKLAPTVPQRDQTHSARGLRRLASFEERFPESEYIGEVQRLRGRVQLRLSRASIQVGHFYWKAKEWKAAERRYRLAAAEHPDSPLVPKAVYRRGLCLWHIADELAETPEEAADLREQSRAVLGSVIANYPESPFSDRAQRFLVANPESEFAPAPAVDAPAPAVDAPAPAVGAPPPADPSATP